MTVNLTIDETQKKPMSKRFLSLDIARGIAIILMIVLHIIGDFLNTDVMLNVPYINDIAVTNLLALVILPFLGGLAGFFLLVSSIANMVSMQKHLERGKSIRSLVLKQIIGGILLLFFAMLSESILGYHGVVGNFFRNIHNPAAVDYSSYLYAWNIFETIHTIAWCLILNGCIQGVLSLNDNWKNTRKMIISYVVIALVIIGLTQPVWDIVGLIGPGYPWGTYPNGHQFYTPWIGSESFWHIARAPFLTMLASPWEPIFPYLAVSCIGSIIGIVISQPKEKISKHFPRNVFLIGGSMFFIGIVGIVFTILKIMTASYLTIDSFDAAIAFYQNIGNHRFWAPDNSRYFSSSENVPIMPFAWVFQFLALNGFSLLMMMLLFRLIEFRGKSKVFAKRTKIIRRFGIVAFSNYNNQSIYVIMFFLTSLMITRQPFQKLFWSGIVLTIILSLLVFSLLLYGWEKIKYTGSLEWFIRTITNNLVPARKDRFGESTKWWQKGQIDVENTFYNAEWINLDTTETVTDKDPTIKPKDSVFSFRLALVGLCSIFFIVTTIFSLFISIKARKTEGKNNYNTAGLAISIVGIILLAGVLITTLSIKIGVLGLF